MLLLLVLIKSQDGWMMKGNLPENGLILYGSNEEVNELGMQGLLASLKISSSIQPHIKSCNFPNFLPSIKETALTVCTNAYIIW